VNRRRFLSICAATPLAAYAGEADRAYGRCLPDHLRALAARAAETRRRALDELTTVEAVVRRQAWVRETLWRLAGGKPERTDLAVRITGELVRPGYRVEKLVYESRPGLHVTANLYVPTVREGPFPGVLFQMGHLPAGKGAEPYQRACQALAKLGCVVLGFDPAGEGERVYHGGLGSSDAEHDRTGAPMLLAGDTQTGLMLWDAVRSLDVLASRPEVDPRRLASAGHSGGGTLTMLLAAVDDRLAAAAISCANTENVATACFDPPGAVDDAEQDLPGGGPLGLDRWDWLHPLAPKPLLVLVSTLDPVATYSPGYLVNGREELERLRRVYALLGEPDHVRWVETPEPHGLTPGRRIEMERWLGRFLLPEGTAGDFEPETAPEPEEVTWVVPGGDAVRTLGGKTPLGLARERVAGAPGVDLPAALGLVRPAPGRAAVVVDSSGGGAAEVDVIEVEPAPAVRIPAWLFRPPGPGAPRSVVIALDPRGRRPDDEDAWRSLSAEGHAVCVADVRGTGALRAELGPGASGYARAHDAETSFAWASLILGESLVAQRVADILALVEGLTNHTPLAGCPLALAAEGALTVAALFAAALDRRIGIVYLHGGLASYRSVLDAEDGGCPLANILPGVLACADLPEIAAAVGPRPVVLTGPVDGAGRLLPEAEARAMYRAAPNVRVVPGCGAWPSALGALLDPRDP
jgi:cephalosporin-C deacetylase-like acetyl esterase